MSRIEQKLEHKKNPDMEYLWGQHKKIREEIAIVNLELMGKTGDIEIDQKLSLKADDIDLVGKFRDESEKPMNRQLNVVRLAKIIICDKSRTKDRLYMEKDKIVDEIINTEGAKKEIEKDNKPIVSKEKTKEHLKWIDKEELDKIELTEEDMPDVERMVKEMVVGMKDGKKLHKIREGFLMNIKRKGLSLREKKKVIIAEDRVKRGLTENGQEGNKKQTLEEPGIKREPTQTPTQDNAESTQNVEIEVDVRRDEADTT